MKSCPVCGAVAFDDAQTCFGCLHRYGADGPSAGARVSAAPPAAAPAVTTAAPEEAPAPRASASAPAGRARAETPAPPLEPPPLDPDESGADGGDPAQWHWGDDGEPMEDEPAPCPCPGLARRARGDASAGRALPRRSASQQLASRRRGDDVVFALPGAGGFERGGWVVRLEWTGPADELRAPVDAGSTAAGSGAEGGASADDGAGAHALRAPARAAGAEGGVLISLQAGPVAAGAERCGVRGCHARMRAQATLDVEGAGARA